MDPILSAITKLGADHDNIEVIWIYGSRAKGNYTEQSDYDLAIAFKSFPENEWEKRLQPEELALNWAQKLSLNSEKLSIIDINHVPLTLAYSVMAGCKTLLEKNTLRKIKEEQRISSMWEIDHLYHKAHYG